MGWNAFCRHILIFSCHYFSWETLWIKNRKNSTEKIAQGASIKDVGSKKGEGGGGEKSIKICPWRELKECEHGVGCDKHPEKIIANVF